MKKIILTILIIIPFSSNANENAKEKKVAIIVRVPLASGLLTGKFNKDSSFAPDDHRNYKSMVVCVATA